MSEKKDKKTEKVEESKIRAYFVSLFGKYDLRNEKQFLFFGKWLIFIFLMLIELLVVLQGIERLIDGGRWGNMILRLSLVGVLTASMAVQLFAVRGVKGKLAFYIIDSLSACGFLYCTEGVFAPIIYLLVWTQVYFEVKGFKTAFFLFLGSAFLYIVAFVAQRIIFHGMANGILQILSLALGFIVAITAHFLVLQIALAFYRQYLKLDTALRDLDASKKELEKAYEVVAEVSALEERQRIAKEIHDTAGHSLTTVIMQTESAKRIIDTNPQEAKSKIISANLQAKHALEELRDGVHLLSGTRERQTLADALLDIVHESTDGTGITVRSSIAEVEVSPSKHRFLCNTLKEGISNGLRHGGATAFWFELKVEDGKMQFLLSDNGKGGKEGWTAGFGLTTMRERATALGGEVSFFSDGEGFEIRLSLPVDGEQ